LRKSLSSANHFIYLPRLFVCHSPMVEDVHKRKIPYVAILSRLTMFLAQIDWTSSISPVILRFDLDKIAT